MPIERIERMQNVGIFQDFRWKSLPDFGEYNLIYGWNGTGKSTLSRLFDNLRDGSSPDEGSVSIKIDGNRYTGEQFADVPVDVRVFNREFINRSVFKADGSDADPIFVLGEQSVELQQEVETLKTELELVASQRHEAEERRRSWHDALDKHCRHRAAEIKRKLSPLRGGQYLNYDKNDYRALAEEIACKGQKEQCLLFPETLQRTKEKAFAPRHDELNEVHLRLPQISVLSESVNSLLRETVVTNAIEALDNDQRLRSWVFSGVVLHKERSSEQCMFCESPLPDHRLQELEAYFTAEHRALNDRIESEVESLRDQLRKVTEARSSLPDASRFYPHLQNRGAQELNNLTGSIEKVEAFVESAIDVLELKKANMFESWRLNVSIAECELPNESRVNEVISEHNQTSRAHNSTAREAGKQLEASFAAEAVDEFVLLRDTKLDVEESLERYSANEKDLRDQIERLQERIMENRRPAQELNGDLSAYLGHDELQLEVRDVGYRITRQGKPITKVSEGETTAIALLYFLKSLTDRSFDREKGVVVIDDPVSSLDHNATHLALGYIRERTNKVAQLFVLTHDFTCFREMRDWFQYLKSKDKRDCKATRYRYYMLRCILNHGGRNSAICKIDPLLTRYKSEYHYLFKQVYLAAISDETGELEANYMLPNMARRLLEAFFMFRQSHVSGGLYGHLQHAAYDGAKKHRIYMFVQAHSHGEEIDEKGHDLSMLSEAQPVLADIMGLIKAEDEKHYDSMLRAV